ncbi:hypothetical protein J4416_01250 [Candidatus Pacearchaeota archaeon]|nr:hypothetical protein [Candidatus Pacearchaeota archaeon]
MNAEYQPAEEQYFVDVNNRIKNVEERQRLLRDKLLLIGKNVIEDRESTMNELQELKKILFKTSEENLKIQDFLKKVADQLSETARKEELLMLQRQIELFMTASGKRK